MENFLLILLIVIAFIVLTLLLYPIISQNLRFKRLEKIGQDRAGTRCIKEILEEVNSLNDALYKCQAEITQLLSMPNNELDNALSKVPVEESKLVKITFNSKEIACRYKGVDVPKYMKNENDEWFEFESLASYDNENRAIVDDSTKTYITIHDIPSNSGFFFKKLDVAPILNEKIENELEFQ